MKREFLKNSMPQIYTQEKVYSSSFNLLYNVTIKEDRGGRLHKRVLAPLVTMTTNHEKI